MGSGTNNTIGAFPEANSPKILAEVVGKFFSDVSGTNGLQIADEP